jgi:imidazolonepropionase-like amidohydrolase
MIALWWSVRAVAACTVVTGAKLHLESGVVDGSVVIVDDRIAGVGAKIDGLTGSTYRGATCAAVDGAGKELTAGLIAAPTNLGLVEIDLEDATRDDDAKTDQDQIRAALYAADAYDPLSVLIPVQRMGGITTALTAPSGGFVSGQAAVVRLDGQTQAQAVVERDAALILNLPTASFAEGLQQVRELVADVRTYASKPASYDAGRPFYPGASPLDLQTLRPAVEGKLPIVVGANAASDLEALTRLKGELGLNLVISGAAEGWVVADRLAAAKIPVMVDPLVYGPYGFDQTRGSELNPVKLDQAGVPLILAAGDTHNLRNLRQLAGNAVRAGLDHEAALRAITSTPARVFGLADRGRIEVGAVADLVLWSGDPFELSTFAEHVWIGGRDVELRSRQTELREKYRSLPGTPVPPLTPR